MAGKWEQSVEERIESLFSAVAILAMGAGSAGNRNDSSMETLRQAGMTTLGNLPEPYRSSLLAALKGEPNPNE